MSDVEQERLAVALAEALPPLWHARATEQDVQRREWNLALQVAALKERARALERDIVQCLRAERFAATLEEGRAWRTQRQALEQQRHPLGAELAALTQARVVANDERRTAMAAYDTVAKRATVHYRAIRASQSLEANDSRDTSQGLDAQDQRHAAFQDLCGLVGVEEATRVQEDRQYRPAWIRE